jgi:hypothetical protein
MSSPTRSAHVGVACLTALLVVSLASDTPADERAAHQSITARERAAVLDKVIQVFDHYYPDPALAKKMLAQLREEEARGAYDHDTEMASFTSQLTQDMRSISKDDHITVWPYEKLPDDLAAETRLGSPDDNFGFRKVELLPGNIGYLKLTAFSNPRTAAPTAIAAMNFVAHCDALIFDLRSNGGCDEIMARFLSSYLFPQRAHLVDVQVPSEDRLQQYWTLEWVPGPRLSDVPVYVLLNRLSYSSSEHFAFALQQAGRAVVVGERTRGGAHAVKYLSFPEVGVNIRVPYTTAVKPDTQESYVGGVVPDVPASSEDALAAAAVRAISDLLPSETDGRKRFVLEWTLAGYKAQLEPVVVDTVALSQYAGAYGDSTITLEGDRLYLQRKDRRKRALVPLGHDDFMFEDRELAHYRIQFTRDDSKRVDGYFTHDSDGDRYPPLKRAQ